MQAKELERRLCELAEPVAKKRGLSVWDVDFSKEGSLYYLTLFIDRPDRPVDIEDCEAVSREVDPMLDAPEFDSLPSYTFCVSSPGVDRRLRTDDHLSWALGKEIELKFFQATDGAKSLTGTLSSFDLDAITLKTDAGERTFLRKDLALIRLAFSF